MHTESATIDDNNPIEVPTDHSCILGRITGELAQRARSGLRGDDLSAAAVEALGTLDKNNFDECCAADYLRLAPEEFPREIQLPVASADVAELDTRVLLWPAGASDAQHPHRDGWAVVMRMRGRLVEYQKRNGEPLPERTPQLYEPELISPEEGITHHLRNVGDEVGLTIHIFGT